MSCRNLTTYQGTRIVTMTSSNGNISRVTGPLWRESIHWSLVDSHHKGQWRRALMFLWSEPEKTVEQLIETPVIWGAIAFIMTSLQWYLQRPAGDMPHFVLAYHSLKIEQSGPWFNIKMTSYQYRKSHCGDKTVVRSSYLHNGISYTGKMSSLYWIGAQVSDLDPSKNPLSWIESK